MTSRSLRRCFFACLISSTAALLWLVLPTPGQSPTSQAQTGQAPKLPHPVLDVPGLMKTFNQPLYTRLHELMQHELNNDRSWNNVQFEGLRAAEVANLIVIRRVPQQIVPTVVEHATELQAAGLALAAAGRTHNVEQTTQAYHRLLKSCNACHTALAPGKLPELTP